MLMQRCENVDEIRLTRTTIQHNEEAGMRNDDLYRQRMQQLHGRIGVGGPLQRRIVRFLKKRVVSLLQKRIGSLLQKRFFSF
jgi:hypothetical protein